ncbi:MAG: hypothetical protein HYS56_03965 [Candidatus Omnitrophica bacterium]|nr:hypothetical protein [Candidatus Omnitrophota bacterium]
MNRCRCFILVTENYRGARQAALDLSNRGIAVDLLIQEKISADALAVISPKPLIQIHAWTRTWFLPLTLLRMMTHGVGKMVKVVTTDHKTYARYRCLENILKHQTLLLRMKDKRYVLSKEGNNADWENCFGLSGS